MTDHLDYLYDKLLAESNIRADMRQRAEMFIDGFFHDLNIPDVPADLREKLITQTENECEELVQDELSWFFGDGSHQPLGIITGAPAQIYANQQQAEALAEHFPDLWIGADHGTADHNSWRPKAHFYGHEYYSLRPEYRKPGRRNWMR